MKRDSLKIKLVPKEEEQEVYIHMKEEDKHHRVASEVKSFTGNLKSLEFNITVLFMDNKPFFLFFFFF